MYIGQVIGSVVATVKISHLAGRTLLLVDQLDGSGKETGAYDIVDRYFLFGARGARPAANVGAAELRPCRGCSAAGKANLRPAGG